MIDYKFVFILTFMKGVHFLQPSMIAKNKNLWIGYENGYDENLSYFIDILP